MTKPPPLPPRPRAYVQELPIGGSPLLSPDTNARLAAVNNGTVREIQQTFPPPRGKALWGAPDVTALHIMIGAALERAAKYGKLEAYEELRQRAARNVMDIPRDTSIGPWPDDEITKPMRR